MEELKARILEIVEDYEEGISVLDNDMAQAGIDPKSDFVNTIEQLLDERECRAREETRQEERGMFIVRYATVSFNEVIKTIKTLSIIEFLSIKWGLKGKKKSKLNKKK